MDGAPTLPVWTAASYSGPVRAAIPAWKDGGRADLTPVMSAAVRRAAAAAAPTLANAQAADVGSAQLLVVPVPSLRSTVRRRGGDLVAGLAGAVAEELGGRLTRDSTLAVGSSPEALPGAPSLRWKVGRAAVLRRRGGRDQVGLGAHARGRVSRQVSVSGVLPTGAWAVLVDDVVTTGATLAACHDVLVEAGVPVLAAFAIAGTPRTTRSVLLEPTPEG
jgi:predicted amidophosphoribosyltransferase